MSSSFVKRVLSRALLASLFTLISVVGVIAAVRADSSAAVVHHALSAVLWEMFALLADRWALAVPLWLVCVAVQLVRTGYEERSLRAEFPEYGQYAERTKRLIPGVV